MAGPRANTIKATHEVAAKDLGESAVNKKVCRELWSKVIPGILDDYDCPNLLPLFAMGKTPRPLFIANGDQDPNCPVEGAKIAMKAAEDAFAKADVKEKLVVRERGRRLQGHRRRREGTDSVLREVVEVKKGNLIPCAPSLCREGE